MYFKCIYLVSMKQKANKKINNVFGVQTKQNFSVLNSSRYGGILHIFKFREKIKQSTNFFFVFSQEIIYIKWFTTCTCILPPNILGFCEFFYIPVF